MFICNNELSLLRMLKTYKAYNDVHVKIYIKNDFDTIYIIGNGAENFIKKNCNISIATPIILALNIQE